MSGKTSSFFLHVKGDEEVVRKQLQDRNLTMVGEPAFAGTSTTVRVQTTRRTLMGWFDEGLAKPPTTGTLINYSQEND